MGESALPEGEDFSSKYLKATKFVTYQDSMHAAAFGFKPFSDFSNWYSKYTKILYCHS